MNHVDPDAITSGNFTCEQCGKIYTNIADFVTHKQLFQNVRHFYCELCETIFSKLKFFTTHLRQCERRKRFSCDECLETFNHEINLRLHKVLHSDNCSTMKCPECQKDFTRLASFKCHLIMHRVDETVVCSDCQEEFLYYYELQKHVKVNHSDCFTNATQLLICKQCDAIFKRPLDLAQHRITHKKIRDSLQIKKRKPANHAKRKDPNSLVKCKFCDKKFSKQSSLDRHERIHTGEKPFVCKICNKSFNQKGSLMFHEAKHLEEKPYKCQLCGVGFTQRGNLRTHVKRVHPINALGRPSYQCPLCPCVMRSLQSLNAHLSKRHNDALKVFNPDGTPKLDALAVLKLNIKQNQVDTMTFPETFVFPLQHNTQPAVEDVNPPSLNKVKSLNNRLAKNSIDSANDGFCGSNIRGVKVRDNSGRNVWLCPFCPRELIRSSDLVRHVRVHTGEKPYKCTTCTKSFALRTTRDQHIRTHFRLKPMRCYICFKELATSFTLKAHMRIHKNEAFECQRCEKRFRTKAHLNTHWKRMHDGQMTDAPLKVFTNSLSDAKREKINNDENKGGDENNFLLVLDEPLVETESGLVQLAAKGSTNDVRTMSCVTYADGRYTFRQFPCDLCPLKFTKLSSLKVHQRSHTGEKPYQCRLCDRRFVTSGNLKDHVKIHSGVKNYSCDKCGKHFRTKQVLQRHSFVHTEERPFLCPYCRKRFRRGVLCRRHIKTHRKDLETQLKSQFDQTIIQNNEQIYDNNYQIDMQNSSYVENSQTIPPTIDQVWIDNQPQTVSDQNYQIIQWNNQPTSVDHSTTAYIENVQPVVENCVMGQEISIPNQEITDSPCLDQFSAAALAFSPTGLQNLMNELEAADNNCAVQLDTQSYPEVQHMPNAENHAYQFVVVPDQTDILLQTNLNEPMHVCSICCINFVSAVDYETHLHLHHGPASVVQQPQQSFVSVPLIGQHNSTGHICSICSSCFLSNQSLNRHMRVVHKEQVVKYACPVCGRQFTRATHVNRHIFHSHRQSKSSSMVENAVQTEESIGPEVSSTVEEVWTTEEHLSDILNEPSTSTALPQRRQRDNVKLNMSGQLPLYDLYPTSTQIANVAQLNCNVDKTFDSAGVYETVITSSSNLNIGGINRRQCPNCPKSFKKPSDLARHIRCHTGEKPFSCDECGRNFRVKSTLIAHKKTHIINNSSMHKCQVCNKDFASRGSLKVHFRLHTNERPYVCNVCSESFRSSGQMKHHLTHAHTTNLNNNSLLPHCSGGTSLISGGAGNNDRSKNNIAISSNNNAMHHSSNTLTCAETSAFTPVGRHGIEYRQDTVVDANNFHDGGLHGSTKVALQILQEDNNLRLLVKPCVVEPVDANTVVVEVTFLRELAASGLTLTIPVSFVEPELGHHNNNGQQTDGGMTTLTVNPLEILHHASFPSTNPPQPSVESLSTNALVWTPVGNSTNNCSNSADFSQTITNPRTNDDETTFVVECRVCNLKFTNADESRRHFASGDHETALLLSGSRNNNQQEQQQQQQRRLCCDRCDKSFPTLTRLRRHLATHTGYRPHLCPVCGECFTQKNTMKKHFAARHTTEKPNKCVYCLKLFTHKYNMKKHIQRVHHTNGEEQTFMSL